MLPQIREALIVIYDIGSVLTSQSLNLSEQRRQGRVSEKDPGNDVPL